MQQQELVCVAAIIDVAGIQCATISVHLFTVVISVIALHRTEDISVTVSVTVTA